jgi:acetolactate synthase I/II/III large subunit
MLVTKKIEREGSKKMATHVPTANGTEMTGATSLVKSLEAAGVEVMFGLPGGAILPAYDPIFDSTIRHILVRHEQGAGHAATGYAQVTGKALVSVLQRQDQVQQTL